MYLFIGEIKFNLIPFQKLTSFTMKFLLKRFFHLYQLRILFNYNDYIKRYDTIIINSYDSFEL
jgi:hypothetical protein